MASMHQQTGKKGEEIQNKHAEMIGAQAKRQDRNRKKKKKNILPLPHLET